jgi:hypothetical protein
MNKKKTHAIELPAFPEIGGKFYSIAEVVRNEKLIRRMLHEAEERVQEATRDLHTREYIATHATWLATAFPDIESQENTNENDRGE